MGQGIDRLGWLKYRGRFPELPVLVVGDVMLDTYLIGDSDRLSPEAPVPIVDVRERRNLLGGAANVAANARAMNAQVTLMGYYGTDIPGEQLREELLAQGIVNQLVRPKDYHTIVKTRIVSRGQQIVRVDEEHNRPLLEGEELELLERIEQWCDDQAGTFLELSMRPTVLIEDYNKGTLSPRVIERLMKLTYDRGMVVVVDPKVENFWLYEGATVVKPNLREFIEVANGRDGNVVWDQLGADFLVVTLGADGMDIYAHEGDAVRIPSVAQEIADVSGAGDTVTAWIGVGLGSGMDIEPAVRVANVAAGLEVAKAGVAVISPEEVDEELRK